MERRNAWLYWTHPQQIVSWNSNTLKARGARVVLGKSGARRCGNTGGRLIRANLQERSTMIAVKSTRNAARKAAPENTNTIAESIQPTLRVIAVELRCALSAVALASRALCDQNADIDADAALVLQRAAAAPLHTCLERIELLLQQLAGTGAPTLKARDGPVH